MSLGAVLVALLLAEGVLRLVYPTVPSLSPLHEADLVLERFEWDHPNQPGHLLAECYDRAFVLHKVNAQAQAPEPHGAHTVNIWLSGDSLAAGVGAPPGRGFGRQLALSLQETMGKEVKVTILASPGGDFCSAFSHPLRTLMDGAAPDLLIIELFADDLEDRAALATGGRLIMLPSRVRSPVGRFAVSRSYVANLGWYALRPEAHVGLVRLIDAQGRALFSESVSELVEIFGSRGVPVVIALLAPSGMAQCPPDPPERSRCRWLGDDLDLMARLLSQRGIDFVDLRQLWNVDVDYRYERELNEDFLKKHVMAIHPNEAGHTRIAEALLEPSLRALSAGERRR